MRSRNSKFLFAIASFASLAASASAYIDPSTGGVLLNTIWPFVVDVFSATLAFLLKWFWKPIKKTFGKLKGEAKGK